MNAFAAMSDPTRQRVIELLAQGPKSASEIQSHFTTSPSAVSQHLKVLREAQLVTVQVDAQRRIYSLNFETIDEASEWLKQIRSFWSPRLDQLQKQMEEQTK